jgi:hypothetical protein
VRTPGGKRPLGRPRRRCENNIKIDLREILWGGRDWIHLVQYRDRWSSCENCNESSGSIKCWEILEYLRDWRLLSSMELVGYPSSKCLLK